MQIILLDTVQNLGKAGDQIKVKPGYARNFLIPQGYAVRDTAENRAEALARKAELDSQQREQLAHAQARATALGQCILTIPCKAGKLGRLYGSVGVTDIVKELAARGHLIKRAEVRMGKQTFREVGDYDITLSFHRQVKAVIKIKVIAAT